MRSLMGLGTKMLGIDSNKGETMMTKEHEDILLEAKIRVLSGLDYLEENIKDQTVLLACFSSICLPIYHYLVSHSDKKFLDKMYKMYLTQRKEQEGNLDS